MMGKIYPFQAKQASAKFAVEMPLFVPAAAVFLLALILTIAERASLNELFIVLCRDALCSIPKAVLRNARKNL